MTPLTNEQRAALRAKVGPQVCEAIGDLISAAITIGRLRKFDESLASDGIAAEDRLLTLIADRGTTPTKPRHD